MKQIGQTLLLDHENEYSPASSEHMRLFAEILRELQLYKNVGHFLWRDEIVLSMSLLSSGRESSVLAGRLA